MSNTVCICCAERMTVPGAANPNLCAACEQLLADDCAALERLAAESERADSTRSDVRPGQAAEHSERLADSRTAAG